MDAGRKDEAMERYVRQRFLKAAECREQLTGKELRDPEAFYACLHAYTLAKYLLPEEETEDSIELLAVKSVSWQMKIPEEVLSRNDRPAGCTKATAVADKKVLLLLNVSKALGVKLLPEEVPAIKTVRQLAKRLWKG